MGGTMGSEGINRLASVLQGRMRTIGDKPQELDFGVIQEDMSLLMNRFPKPIPQKDYVVCGRARGINPGDRVLAAWVGDDVCVIDVILPGTTI